METNLSFDQALGSLIERAGCTASQLSKHSGVSAAALSRYRNGVRVPSPESDIIVGLARALSELSQGQPQPIGIDEATALLVACAANEKPSVSAGFSSRFDALCGVSDIKMSDLAASTNFDASFLSRVRSGQRRPANLEAFCRSVAQCIVAGLSEKHKETVLEDIAGIRIPFEGNPENAVEELADWLLGARSGKTDELDQPVQSFLEHLDEFDLNDYLAALHFDQLKVPTTPFTIPGSKDYYQVEGMRQAELDFLRITATSSSSKHVIMCSDLPMEAMAEDPDFAKKWIMGLGALMKRGIRLTVVHGVNRPMSELMLGLESWIPLYMTGLVEPLYFKNPAEGPFQRLDYVSEVASLKGECVRGFHAQGRYRLEKGKREVAYQLSRMKAILSYATPLMQIYREGQQEEFDLFMQTHGHDARSIDSSAFKNLSIMVKTGEWALVEKRNAPLMRFVITHPRLVSAIESFVAPYGQDGFNK